MAALLDRTVVDIGGAREVFLTLLPNADTALGDANWFWCPTDPAVAARFEVVPAGTPWKIDTGSLVPNAANQVAVDVMATPVAAGGKRVLFELSLKTDAGRTLLQHRYDGEVTPGKAQYRVIDLLRLR